MSARCIVVIGLSLILCGAAQEEPGKGAQEEQYYDILGRLNVASGFAHVGAIFPVRGHRGFRLPVRNWDPEQSIRELQGMVGFAASAKCRISEIEARVPEGLGLPGRPFPEAVVYPNGCQFRFDGIGLEPGETVILWVTLTSEPPDGYAVALEAEY